MSNNILKLTESPFIWIIFGISLFYIFFTIAKSFIVFFGGIIFGLYMYNIFVPNNNFNIKNIYTTIKNSINKITKK